MNLRKIQALGFLLSRLDAGRPHLFRPERHAPLLLGRSESLAGPALLVGEHLSSGAAHAADRLGRRAAGRSSASISRACIALHLLLSIAWELLRLSLEAAFHLTWNEFWPIKPPITVKSEITLLFIFGFHTGVVTYWVVLSIQTAIRNYARFQERAQAALRSDLRASQLETQVAQARLGALKAQLQPHFLFNTLNAIVVLVRQQKGQQAEETLARFSDLLRAVLADMDAQEVTLARELEYLKLYLSIEQLRFSDRLRVDIDVDPELLDAAVPHMALQPHRRELHPPRRGPARHARRHQHSRRTRVGDALHVMVQDDGPGSPRRVRQRRTQARARQYARAPQAVVW